MNYIFKLTKRKSFYKNSVSSYNYYIYIHKQGFQKKQKFSSSFGYIKTTPFIKKIYINKQFFYKWCCVNKKNVILSDYIINNIFY